MHKHHGFTIVEAMVVIVILTILLTVSVMGVRGAQVSSRNKERVADIDTLAMNLETMYSKEIRNASNVIVKPQGSYPPVSDVPTGGVGTIPAEILGELNAGATKAPGSTASSVRSVHRSKCTTTSGTTCTLDIPKLIQTANITESDYVYVPFVAPGDNRLCSATVFASVGSCRSFKLYYLPEGSSTTVKAVEGKRL